jgi:hypothetical protein
MENVNVTEEQAKKLKLFTYYAQGYGHNKVYYEIYLQDCTEDWRSDYWNSKDGTFDSYDSIDSVIDEIIEENNLYESVDDCDNRGGLSINIDCIERTLKITASETRYGVINSGDEISLEALTNEGDGFVEIFNYMNSKNYSEGVIDFDGGGDNGQISDTITYDGTKSQKIPKDVESFLYEWLEKHLSGWENNEGAQGNFTFLPKESILILDFGANTEDDHDLGQVFYTKF